MEIRNSKQQSDKVPFRFLASGDAFRDKDHRELYIKTDTEEGVRIYDGTVSPFGQLELVTIAKAHVELD